MKLTWMMFALGRPIRKVVQMCCVGKYITMQANDTDYLDQGGSNRYNEKCLGLNISSLSH